MIVSYFKIALRNLEKYRLFSIVNIMGMAISLATCILIALFVSDELKYDRHHADGHRIYRVYNFVDQGGVESYRAITPYPFASYMQKDFPEIESTLRIMDTYEEQLFDLGKKKILQDGGFFAEPGVFEMLSLKILSSKQSPLAHPNTIAISSSLATKYYGDQNALGQTITINNTAYDVVAVFADAPRHFHLKVNYLISFTSTNWEATWGTSWQRQQIITYLKLKPGTNAEALEAKFKPFVEKYAYPTIREKGFIYIPYLQNIRDIHLHSANFDWDPAQRGNSLSVYILSGTALMILIIASLNFINLSTARSVKRMKEVGIRKVVGAYRHQLILQFVSEGVLITFAGLLFAVVMSELSLPYLNDIIDKKLTIPYRLNYISGAVIFSVVLGLLAGSFPAFQLSRFKPALVLAKMGQTKKGSALFRQSLVVLQFMLSFFLITGSWIVLSQNDLLQNKDMGFNKDQVIAIPLTRPQLAQQTATKQKYMDHPNVLDATIAFGLPGDLVAGDEVINPADGKTYGADLILSDFDYIRTMGMRVIAGRDFSADITSDSSKAFIINETAARTYGFGTPEQAIGKELHWRMWWTGDKLKKGQVIGVVQDFNFKSLREKMTPVVIQVYPRGGWKIALRIKPENIDATIAHLKATYESLEQDYVFTYTFLDQKFEAMYRTEQRLGKLFSIFTYLAIAVACMGLFGLVEYSVNQRSKEISIRKVFGASISSLLILLTRQYFVLLVMAFVLAVPIVYYMAQQWLDDFAYRVDIEPLLLVKAAGAVVGITIFTVLFQSLKAAKGDPARILKNE